MEKEENWTEKRISKGGVNNKFFIVQEPLREEVHHFKRVRSNKYYILFEFRAIVERWLFVVLYRLVTQSSSS